MQSVPEPLEIVQQYMVKKEILLAGDPKHLCKSCAKAKITRRSFHPNDPDTPQVSRILEKVTVDIAVYLNCSSR